MKTLLLASIIGSSFLTASAFAEDKVSTLNKFFNNSGEIVTADTYPTHETSLQLLKNQGLADVNTFQHRRVLTQTDDQPVVRMNRDTYYSFAVVDVSKGATLTMPEIPKGKYMSYEVVTEDHRIQAMKYGDGTFNLTTHQGTHIYLIIRLDATFSSEEATKIQDQMRIDAKSNTKFTAVPVDKASFDKVENELKAQAASLTKRDGGKVTYGMFTDPRDSSNELFTQEKYTVGAAIGWGGAQLVDNIYELSGNYPVDKCYQATFEDPKNKAFWSFTVYDKKGFMFNDLANLSSDTAKANADGTYTLSFGCGSDAINNIPTKNASGVFNLAIRHYIPSDKVRNEGYRLIPFVKEK